MIDHDIEIIKSHVRNNGYLLAIASFIQTVLLIMILHAVS